MSGIIGGIGAGSRSGVIGELLVGNDIAIGATAAYVPGSAAGYTGPELLLYGDQPVMHLHSSGTGSPQWEMAAYNQDLRISDDGVDRLAINSTGDVYSKNWTSITTSQTGMSSASQYFASYMRLGSLIYVQVWIYGTGNATTWTATLNNGYDNDSTSAADAPISVGYAVNDGNNVSHLANGWITPGGQVVTFQLNGASGGWTASGSRHMQFSAIYRANSI